jgi:hypothetical protein
MTGPDHPDDLVHCFLNVVPLFRCIALLASLQNGVASKGDQYSHLFQFPS